MTTIEASREQTRARYPDRDGYVERDGVRIFYEVYGTGEPTVLLLPTWSVIHSRHWKSQIPYLARHARVVTFDGRGNGRTDRPEGVDAYAEREFAADTLAVMDATGTDRPELRERVAHVDAEWRAVLSEALAEPRERYGIDMPLPALVSLVITFNEGIIWERLSGIETGQAELLEWIDGWLREKEEP